MADDGISENHGLINSSDIYKDVHMELITTEITNSYDKTSTMEEVGGVVDMSGALNATAALSASAALKLNESNRKTESEQTMGKITGITTNTSGFSEFVDPVKKENINAQNKNVGSAYINRSNVSAGVLHGESTTMVRPLKPEAFIDGIEKFVNFVSKEGLTRKKSDNETPVEQSAMNTSLSKSTNQTVFKTTSNTETKLVDSEREIKNKDIKNRTGDADDVDADLKSYALAVNDMLESEVEIAADGNELDAEIKTMVVSNDDTGEVKMTLTDSAVGRFETIGKNDDAVSTIADGLSPLRKSQRAKKRKVYQDFDQADIILSVELDNVVDEVSKAIEEDEEVKKTSVGTKQKSKRKNPSPKKAKLTVEEVYESDSNEESDGDINKDILKVRMAKCDVCDKHFLDRKKLEEHKRRHKKKPVSQSDYPCVVCGKIFLKREHWRRHVKIHDDVRPYACPVCKKGFRRKEHVKRHMLIHTGEKPFECMFCSQRYQRADHLKKHLHQHTKDDYQVKQRKGDSLKSKGKRRKPTAKAAKLVARSRVVKEEMDYDVTEEDEHYSDGLSDDDNLTTNDGLELSLNNSE